MADLNTEPTLTTEAIVQRGRLALESLQFREEAARIHAARIDLQAALGDAEEGNTSRLQHWLDQYHSLVDNAGTHFLRNSIGADSHDPQTDPPIIVDALYDGTPPTLSDASDSVEDASRVDTIQKVDTVQKKVSPWESILQAAMDREHLALVGQSLDESSLDNDLISDEIFTDECVVDEFLMEEHFESREHTDTTLVEFPESIQLTVVQPKTPVSLLKNQLWLTPAFLFSTGAHFIVVAVMSAYVIRLATTTEPMAIVASPIDTEMVSMESPVELPPSETPEVETTALSTPDLPSVATALASISSSSMSLPTSVAGVGPGPGASMPSSSVGEAVGEAIGSKMSSVSSMAVAKFFGTSAAGNTFCYVVDRSGSMKGGAFEAAKEEIIRSLSSMKPKQRFYIFFFGDEIEGMKLSGKNEESFPVYATPENIQKTIVWMDRVKTQGGKHPAEVIERAIEMDPDGIFLLFDGETTVDLAPKIRKVNLVDDFISGPQTRVPIHSVCFYTDKPEAQQLMKTIAQQNLGTYRYVPKPK